MAQEIMVATMRWKIAQDGMLTRVVSADLPDGPYEVIAWLSDADRAGYWCLWSTRKDRYTFRFSDENVAFEFRMRWT